MGPKEVKAMKAKPKAKNPHALMKAKKAAEKEKESQRTKAAGLVAADIREGGLDTFAAPVAATAPPSITDAERVLAPPAIPTLSEVAPPAVREVNAIGPQTPVVAPAYCAPREGRAGLAVARLRPGVPVNDNVKGSLEDNSEACDDKFLASLVQGRLDNTKDSVTHVCSFGDSSEGAHQRMNMDKDLTVACVSMMQNFDFTYASLCSVGDVDKSAASLPCLYAIEPFDGKSVVSHAFCLVYKLFMLRLTKTKMKWLLTHGWYAFQFSGLHPSVAPFLHCQLPFISIHLPHPHSPQAKVLALIYMRYTMAPADFLSKCGLALVDETEVVLQESHEPNEADEVMTVGTVVETLLRERDFLEVCFVFPCSLSLPTHNPPHPSSHIPQAVFPEYTEEEKAYIKAMLPRLKVERTAAKATQRRLTEAMPPAERKAEHQQRRREERAAAREERRKLVDQVQKSALLYGFSDIGVQVWFCYVSVVQGKHSQCTLCAL